MEVARADFEKLTAVADRVFWRATDRCMRDERSKGQSTPESEFIGAYECKLVDLKQLERGGDKVFVGTVRLINPDTPEEWFEIKFEEAGIGWKGLDCTLVMDGHEMNYFEGRFLYSTNLKPYVDESIHFFLNSDAAKSAPEPSSEQPDDDADSE